MAQKATALLRSGTFADRAGAQAALDALIGVGEGNDTDLDVAFYGAHGEYVLWAVARSPETERWVTRVLVEHGAVVQESPLVERLTDKQAGPGRGAPEAGARDAEERALLARWADAAVLLLGRGLLAPHDLITLLVAAGERPDELAADERQRRLREADDELAAVAKKLEATLRAGHPELFDRRGRLRSAALARRLAERTGGKQALSGTELQALEDRADLAAGRSAGAP
jgi:hypothetical protein